MSPPPAGYLTERIDDTRDKVTALGVEVKHLNERLDDMGTKLDEIHAAFQQAKGVKLAMMVGFTVFGGAIGAAITKALAYFGIVAK